MNYNESSEEEDFNSPLVSPSRPPVTRAGSPVELAIPTLNDNVDEDLEAVRQTLNNVGHTHSFRGTRPIPGARPEPEGGDQSQPATEELVEEVVEGHVYGGGDNPKVGAGDDGSEEDNNMPDAVDFESENGQDCAKASELGRQIKVEFSATDIKCWFAELEA